MRVRRAALLASCLLVSALLYGCAMAEASQRKLRVCADPNNMPFSNSRQEGFENRIASLIARDMSAKVEYTWFAQRRGFIRNTLNTSVCDLVMGVPASFDLTLVSEPYYRSSYVFVTRHDRRLAIKSFDDPSLRSLRIGVQLVGDDGANTPPVHALDKRGIRGNLKGYMVYGDYLDANPGAAIVQAVAKGEVDVAVVWGPIAGYFARGQPVKLDVVPVSPQVDLPFMPFVFDIALGVRRQDKIFRDELDTILRRERPAISAILNEYGIPRVGTSTRPTA
ncbi:MAG TPA: substrate-binding domain-containing protein [Gemmatimonadaceae bacterium]|nr:substrate-binding domain-containing protein [Gemmatimonadaceae bacterium]